MIKDTLTYVRQCLLDCGLDDTACQTCLTYIIQKRTEHVLLLLARQRQTLLDACHSRETQLDTTDFIMHALKKLHTLKYE